MTHQKGKLPDPELVAKLRARVEQHGVMSVALAFGLSRSAIVQVLAGSLPCHAATLHMLEVGLTAYPMSASARPLDCAVVGSRMVAGGR